jgi:hypothetical protein
MVYASLGSSIHRGARVTAMRAASPRVAPASSASALRGGGGSRRGGFATLRRGAREGDGDASEGAEAISSISSISSSGPPQLDANERLREALRREAARAPPSAPPSSPREYRITVRGEEVVRYTLPDFFPDFNDTPLEARRGAGGGAADDRLESAGGSSRGSGTYVWKRGVLAGTERSDPPEVIARYARERAEAASEGASSASSSSSASVSGSGASSSASPRSDRDRRRRVVIPPPPGREALDAEAARFDAASGVLFALTVFFYAVSLALTTSRAMTPLEPPPEESRLVERQYAYANDEGAVRAKAR